MIDERERVEYVRVPGRHAAPTFAEDVLNGLTGKQKSLRALYFYDDVGSALFDAITKLDAYYLTRAETEILRESSWEIVRALDSPPEFFELGSGSAEKTRLLIDDAIRAHGSLRYSPVDISASALHGSAKRLTASFPDLRIRAYEGDYFDVLASPQLQFDGRVLAMFMGSNIGNLDPQETRALLTSLGKALQPGDGLLLGADLKKDRATLKRAYDDPAGITSAFDKNLLVRINREFDGDFDLANFRHVAEYDERRGVVESYLEALQPAHVRLAALDTTIHFAREERIHTESSYKYDIEQLHRLGAECGFLPQREWFDRAHRFTVTLLVRA